MKVTTEEQKINLRSIVLGFIIAEAIFILDSQLPFGVADEFLYVALVLIGLRSRSKGYILWSAFGGTALISIGFFFSPPGGELWKVIANRALAVFILWVTALLCLWQIRAEKKIREAREELEQRVKDRTVKLDEINELLRRESEFVELHKDIAVASNETQTVEKTLEYSLKRICLHAGWPVGHLYLTAERYSDQLVPAPIWYLEDPTQFETFRNITEMISFKVGEGLPGRVIASGKPAWIIDVTKDPNFPRSKHAKNIGVKAGFAFPIPIGDEIVGVMEFFSTQAVEPDGKMLEIMAQVGTQLGRVLERKRAEEENKLSHEQMRNLFRRLERESEFVELHKDIAVASNETQTVEKTLEYSLKCICAHTGWPVGHLYLTAEGYSDQLVPAPIWYLEDPTRFETFRNITEMTPFKTGEGLPGRVIASGKPAWIIDVTKDANFPRAKLAKNIGVKAGFAFPIPIGDEIVGVMEFFSTQPVEPDSKMLEIMAQVGTQLGRVLERKRAEEENKRSHEQLRNLYRRLELVREEERTRLAREIHDELAQVLTALKLEVSLLDKKLIKNGSSLQTNTQLMLQLIDTTIQAGKKLVMDLRPPLLDDLGLPEAIEWEAKEYERRTGIKCEVEMENNGFALDEERSTTLFRIFQETLTNVTRHAKADKVRIMLKYQKGLITLQVADNGIGISRKQIANLRSLGLLGIRERALVWGGKVDIMGVPNKGTTVTIHLNREI